MNNYLKKVTHILPIYLLAVFLSVLFLGIIRYFLDFQFNFIEIKLITWEFFLTAITSFISIILIRKRFRVLKHKNPAKDTFIYIFIAGLLQCALLINSQMFLTQRLSKSQTIQNIEQISRDRHVTKVKIANYFIDDGFYNEKFETQVTGKNGNELTFNFYFISAILKDSLSEPKNDLPLVWFSDHFSKTISISLSDEKKHKAYIDFRKKCVDSLKKYNFKSITYFKKVPISEEKMVYENIIHNTVNNPNNQKFIILSPETDSFNNKGETTFQWFFKILIIGILIFLFSLFFPQFIDLNEKSVQKEEDDFTFLLKLFIPKGEYFVTPILINLNVFVFLLISFLGVNPFNPRTEDLVKFGALTNDVANGEIWRFISAMFLHGGLMHLIMNMIVLGFVGLFAENSFGRMKFLIIYFVTGILAGISSLLWHQNLIGVGASGAIFGLIGAVAMAIFLSNKLKESKTILLLIFGYVIFNLLMGFVTNSDNVAHISGFLTGAFLGIIFYYTEP